MKIAIIDDDVKTRKIIIKALQEYKMESVKKISEANSVKTGLKLLNNEKHDVVFLDIEMKDGTGFSILDEISTNDFKVIFLSTYKHYTKKALKYNPVDYILKPIKNQEVIRVLGKV